MERREGRLTAIVVAALLFGFFVYGLHVVRMWSVRTWIPDSALRILLINKQTKAVEVLMVWPSLQEPQLLRIPPSVYITAVGGYGNYTSQALLTLGETEGVGDRLLVDSLSFMLASPIHDVYWYSGDAWQRQWLMWHVLRQGLWGTRSLPESIEIIQLLNRVSVSSLTPVELRENAGLRQRTEVDGSVQDYLDSALLSTFLQRNVATLWPAAANIQVAVVNASNMPQMASLWSRYAYLNGFDVVSVTDVPSQQTHTELRYSSAALRDGLPGRALRTLYPLAQVTVGDTAGYRAHVALIIGLDSWQWLHQRAFYLSQYH